MRILLVADRTELREYIHRNFMPRGAEIIQYQNPIKAMDNLDEIDPELVLFSTQDFPRHWKPFLAFLRDFKPREECVFVLLKGADFDHEEADKAQALKVNGIVREELDDKAEIDRLKELVNRYHDIGDARAEKRIVPSAIDKIGFIFTHPARLELIEGRVEDLSATGISFLPANRQRVMDIAIGTLLPACSLRIGDALLALPARVVRNERSLSLLFHDLTDGERSMIRSYIGAHAQRELEQLTHSQ